MMKRITLLGVLVNYSLISAGWLNSPQYKNAALNSVYQEIQQKAINLSTDKAVNSDIVECFEEEFLTDADENAPTGEKRKMQRSMARVRRAYNAPTVSGLILEVNDLVETVALDFQNKEKSLEAEKNGLWGAKLGWGALTIVGLGAVLLTTQMGGGRNKTIAKITGGVGLLTTLGGGVKFCSTIGKEEKLKIHIAKIQTMKNGWENSFRVK